MANNVIMFYSRITNIANMSADLCIYSNTIVNCTVSLTSTLDYTSFAPYDTVECVLLNTPSVHKCSTNDITYNYESFAFMQVGTNPALYPNGANCTNNAYKAIAPLFYISNVSNIGGGMYKVEGVSALALLDAQHYPGGYWNSTSRGNPRTILTSIMSSWVGDVLGENANLTNIIYFNDSTYNSMFGILNTNTNRNAAGQILTTYGWHVGRINVFNDNVHGGMGNGIVFIYSANLIANRIYNVPANQIYIGENISERAQSAGYQVNVTEHYYNSETGCTNAIVYNNLISNLMGQYTASYTCTPIMTDTLRVLIGMAQWTCWDESDKDKGVRNYHTTVSAWNQWVPVDSVVEREGLINTKNIKNGQLNICTETNISPYNIQNLFSCIAACEITIKDPNNFPFPWCCTNTNLNVNSCRFAWNIGSAGCQVAIYPNGEFVNKVGDYVTCVNINVGSLSICNQFALCANTLNVCMTYITASGGGGLTTTSYNIPDIGIISNSGFSQNVLKRVINFATATTTVKLSFPWNGAMPGDILNIPYHAGRRTGMITDMTITLSNIPKATANVRIGWNGK